MSVDDGPIECSALDLVLERVLAAPDGESTVAPFFSRIGDGERGTDLETSPFQSYIAEPGVNDDDDMIVGNVLEIVMRRFRAGASAEEDASPFASYLPKVP